MIECVTATANSILPWPEYSVRTACPLRLSLCLITLLIPAPGPCCLFAQLYFPSCRRQILSPRSSKSSLSLTRWKGLLYNHLPSSISLPHLHPPPSPHLPPTLTRPIMSSSTRVSPPPPSSCTTPELRRILDDVTIRPSSPLASFSNWAGTYKCSPSTTFLPTSASQLPYIFELAKRHGSTVRAAGAGHSPSDLACTTGFMVRTDKLAKVLEVSLKILFPSFCRRRQLPRRGKVSPRGREPC